VSKVHYICANNKPLVAEVNTNQRWASTADSINTAAALALADQLPLAMIVKHGWSGFHVRRAI